MPSDPLKFGATLLLVVGWLWVILRPHPRLSPRERRMIRVIAGLSLVFQVSNLIRFW
jgi:hypothetical protein